MYRHKQVGDFCFIGHQTCRVPIKYKNGNAVYFASQLSTELCWSYLKATTVTILTERQICLEIITNELHCIYQSECAKKNIYLREHIIHYCILVTTMYICYKRIRFSVKISLTTTIVPILLNLLNFKEF